MNTDGNQRRSTDRADFCSPSNQAPSPRQEYVKCITRTRRAVSLFIHHHWVLFGTIILPNGSPADRFSLVTQTVSEELLKSYCLHLNHYPIQSLAFFRDVKMKRGSADYIEYDKVYNQMQYFYDYDVNDIVDDELATLASR
jgi:hypothetical protein